MVYLLCLLLALPFGHHTAPAVFQVQFETTTGSFIIEAHRDWSPHGADRFYELVRTGYYDDSRFFRVVPGRWVQFGINGNPKISAPWRDVEGLFRAGEAILFRAWFPTDVLPHATTHGDTVLFVTCLGDTISPEAGRATVALLERLGHEVVFPEERIRPLSEAPGFTPKPAN